MYVCTYVWEVIRFESIITSRLIFVMFLIFQISWYFKYISRSYITSKFKQSCIDKVVTAFVNFYVLKYSYSKVYFFNQAYAYLNEFCIRFEICTGWLKRDITISYIWSYFNKIKKLVFTECLKIDNLYANFSDIFINISSFRNTTIFLATETITKYNSKLNNNFFFTAVQTNDILS